LARNSNAPGSKQRQALGSIDEQLAAGWMCLSTASHKEIPCFTIFGVA